MTSPDPAPATAVSPRAAAGPLASPGNLLKQAALSWQREFGRRLRPVGITPTQFFVLGAAGWLGRSGDSPTQQQVADFAGVDRMMTSKVLATCEAAGWAERRADPADGRISRVSVTAAGHLVRAAGVAVVTALDRDLFGGLDTDRLAEDLRQIADHSAD